MIGRSCLMLLLGFLAASPAAAQQWAKKMFETTTHDFGSVARHTKTEFPFVLKNIYLEDVHVVRAQPSCGCISTRIDNPLLKTYQEGAIVAVLNTKSWVIPLRFWNPPTKLTSGS